MNDMEHMLQGFPEKIRNHLYDVHEGIMHYARLNMIGMVRVEMDYYKKVYEEYRPRTGRAMRGV